MIAVSHDRYFLRRIATRVLLVEDRKLKDFKGDYEYYLENVSREGGMRYQEGIARGVGDSRAGAWL